MTASLCALCAILVLKRVSFVRVCVFVCIYLVLREELEFDKHIHLRTCFKKIKYSVD